MREFPWFSSMCIHTVHKMFRSGDIFYFLQFPQPTYFGSFIFIVSQHCKALWLPSILREVVERCSDDVTRVRNSQDSSICLAESFFWYMCVCACVRVNYVTSKIFFWLWNLYKGSNVKPLMFNQVILSEIWRGFQELKFCLYKSILIVYQSNIYPINL